MPMPNHCIECDKVATVTLESTPYCSNCAREGERFQKYYYREGQLFKSESKK
jgi:hypothetical protein